MVEALFALLGTLLETLADLLWHSLRARSPWWWIPPVLVSAAFLVLAWAFRASDSGAVPIVFVGLAAIPLLARALLVRQSGWAGPSAAGRR